MEIIYEKIEDFLERMKAVVTQKPDTYVYLSILRVINENNVSNSVISVQAVYDNDIITYRYGDLPVIQLLPESYFDSIQDSELQEKAKKQYESKIDEANATIKTEYEKLKTALQTIGFKHIENAVVQCNRGGTGRI